jgi:hypothetical protein
LVADVPGFDSKAACQQFKSLDPTVIIMGEGPFEAMRVFYTGAKMTKCPFVVLDQYYNDWLLPAKSGVDLVLLYGLKSFWKDELHLAPPYVLVPPFIEAVTPKNELPVPHHLHEYPWVTLVAYEPYVLRTGIDLIASLAEVDTAFIIVSRDPSEADRLLSDAGLDTHRIITLPLQSDPNVFGLFGASRVTLVSNGFLQIMEALALASPVIALERGTGVGMGSLNIDDRFVPFVSFGETREQQRERARQWLAASPFPPSLLDELKLERGGTCRCADHIEELVRQDRTEPGLWRRALQLRATLGWPARR